MLSHGTLKTHHLVMSDVADVGCIRRPQLGTGMWSSGLVSRRPCHLASPLLPALSAAFQLSPPVLRVGQLALLGCLHCRAEGGSCYGAPQVLLVCKPGEPHVSLALTGPCTGRAEPQGITAQQGLGLDPGSATRPQCELLTMLTSLGLFPMCKTT